MQWFDQDNGRDLLTRLNYCSQESRTKVKKRFLVEVDQSHMLRGVAIFTNIPP